MGEPRNERIRRAVSEAYERVARHGSRPPAGLALSTGAALARELGYPEAALGAAPVGVVEAFVGAAPLYAEVRGEPGELVLDLGCGAGLDAWLLSRGGYRVVAADASGAMLARLVRAGPGPAESERPLPVRALLPRLPFRAGAAGWALLNGVANLVPERGELLRDVGRVLRPGGTLLLADLFAVGEIPPELRELPEAWAWCLGGAAAPETWAHDLRSVGFEDVEVTLLEEIPPLARGFLRAVRS